MDFFRRVTVLGPGLLGGSVLKAVRRRASALDFPLSLAVWGRRREPVEALLADQLVDWGSTNLAELFRETEGEHLVVLATPIGLMPGLAEQLAEVVKTPTIVTDVGSTKADLVSRIDGVFEKNSLLSFVGSHPMAGSEKAGLEHADAELFQNATCIVTPRAETEAVAKVEAFWQWLGGATFRMSPENHDRVVAQISHVPHLTAAALTLAGFGEIGDLAAPDFCGNGFRDTTRVASGPPKMWAEILLENRQSVTESLADLIRHLESVQAGLARGDTEFLLEFLTDAKEKRDTLPTFSNTD